MSSCRTQFGTPKIKHEDKQSAIEHAKWQEQAHVHKIDVYRCPKCKTWHIGRRPASKQYKQETWRASAIENKLVGQLVGTLRSTINKGKA